MLHYLPPIILIVYISTLYIFKTTLLQTPEFSRKITPQNTLTPTNLQGIFFYIIGWLYFSPIYCSLMGSLPLIKENSFLFFFVCGFLFFFSKTDKNEFQEVTILIFCWLYLLGSTANLISIILGLELLVYLFILLVFKKIPLKVFFFKKTGLLLFLFLNFLTTIILFIGTFFLLYYYGASDVFFCQNYWTLSVILVGVFLKLSSGPWIFWLNDFYRFLSRALLGYYTLLFFTFVIMLLLPLVLIPSNITIWFCFVVFLLTLSILFKNLYQVTSLKAFLLYSSYTLYTILLLLLV